MNDILLELYFKDMGRYQLLTPEQELEYATAIADSYTTLVDTLLNEPLVWKKIHTRWKQMLDDGKAINKLAEDYGSPKADAQMLTVKVGSNIDAAWVVYKGVYEKASPAFKDVNGPKSYFLRAGLSKEVYTEILDEVLKEEHKYPNAWILDLCRLNDTITLNRDRLITANLRLVINFAKSFQGLGVALPDLIQEGNIGLVRATEKFDPTRAFRFSTYAAWWIRQAFIKTLKKQSKTIRLPAHVHDIMNKLSRLQARLAVDQNKEPTLEEIAELMGVPPETVEKLLNLKSEPISLEAPVRGSQGGSGGPPKVLRDFIVDEAEDPGAVLDVKSRTTKLMSAINQHLNKVEKKIILWRYGLGNKDPHTLEEIARKLGKSRERIRQLEASAINKLRHGCPELEEFQL